jgi:hypothetical protein
MIAQLSKQIGRKQRVRKRRPLPPVASHAVGPYNDITFYVYVY